MPNNIENILQQHNIILFDGVCVICNRWVKFLLKYDHKIQFKLASVQSPIGTAILKHYGMSTTEYSTMLVIYQGQKYVESTALLKVMQQLGFPFSMMSSGYIIPRLIRDFLYRRVALNRYQLFGTTAYCAMPSTADKHHFLEDALHEK